MALRDDPKNGCPVFHLLELFTVMTTFFFTDMEADDSQEMVKDSPKTILLIVLVGILGTVTLGLIGALIFVAKRKRQSGNEPSLLVHEE